jgi:hypothetical protein
MVFWRVDRIANWIQEALRSFSNVKVTESYVLYRDRNQSYSIADTHRFDQFYACVTFEVFSL